MDRSSLTSAPISAHFLVTSDVGSSSGVPMTLVCILALVILYHMYLFVSTPLDIIDYYLHFIHNRRFDFSRIFALFRCMPKKIKRISAVMRFSIANAFYFSLNFKKTAGLSKDRPAVCYYFS